MPLNRTFGWKVTIIWISRELPLFNFERLHIWSALFGHPREKLWRFEFLKSFSCSIWSVSIYHVSLSEIRVKSYDHMNILRASVVQFRASWYVMCLNLTSLWKVMIIWISRELLMFNFKRLNILCDIIGHPCEKLWPFEFLESFRRSISSVSICYVSESHILVKGHDHLNFLRAFVHQFRAPRYIMRLNGTFVWNVRTIWISRELPLFNFEHLDILCDLIGHPCE